MRLIAVSLVLVLVVAVNGCDSSRENEFHVSGDIVFDGKPVPAGYILLSPDVAAGNDGLQGYADIEGGHYDTNQTSRGVSGGKYLLEIHGFELPAQGAGPKPLFREYITPAELSREDNVQDINVPADAGEKQKTRIAPVT